MEALLLEFGETGIGQNPAQHHEPRNETNQPHQSMPDFRRTPENREAPRSQAPEAYPRHRDTPDYRNEPENCNPLVNLTTQRRDFGGRRPRNPPRCERTDYRPPRWVRQELKKKKEREENIEQARQEARADMMRARHVQQRETPAQRGRREAREDMAKAAELRRRNREVEEQQSRVMAEYQAQVEREQKARATKVAKEVLQDIFNMAIPQLQTILEEPDSSVGEEEGAVGPGIWMREDFPSTYVIPTTQRPWCRRCGGRGHEENHCPSPKRH